MVDTAQPKRKHILLVAYQCAPGGGSVSQIGWEWYQRLSKLHRVTLVTHVRNRPILTAVGAPLENSQVEYIDTEWFAAPVFRVASALFPKSESAVFLLSSIDYFPFEWQALRRLKSQQGDWDLVHRVTPVSTTAATRLHTLGLPVVLGPFNNGVPPNPAFQAYLSKEDSTWLIPLRKLAALPERLFGGHRKAAALLVATKATQAIFPKHLWHKAKRVVENGVNPDVFFPRKWPTAPSRDRPLVVSFTGRLVPFKALHLLLRAMARLKGQYPITLTVVGDGPMRGGWESLAQELGLSRDVTFMGAQSAPVVARVMQSSHVFCLPSVRESGGAVVLEAMACARPVIAIDFGGPGEIVTPEVGCLIPSVGDEGVIEHLCTALVSIFESPTVWAQKGVVASKIAAASYTWDAKVQDVDALYTAIGLTPKEHTV